MGSSSLVFALVYEIEIAVAREDQIVQALEALGGAQVGERLQRGGPRIEHHDAVHNMGVVWVFNRIGLPVFRIETCASDKLTNVAYGGSERKDLFILDGSGKILLARMPVPGLAMYAHR